MDKIKDMALMAAGTVEELASNPKFYAAIAIDMVIRKAIEKSFKKTTQLLVGKLVLKMEQQAMKLTSRLLSEVGQKGLAEAAEKLGMRAGQKAAAKQAQRQALKQAQKAAAEAVKKAAKSGASAAAKMAAKAQATAATSAATGPAAPFVFVAMTAFDVLSMGLDIGDAGGYGKMGTVEEYLKMKQGIEDEMEEEVKKKGPGIVGPFDNQAKEVFKKLIEEIVRYAKDNTAKGRMYPPKSIDPLLQPMVSRMNADLESETITYEDLNDDANLQVYIKSIKEVDKNDVVEKTAKEGINSFILKSLTQPVMDQITADLLENKITIQSLNDQTTMDKYLTLVDLDLLFLEAEKIAGDDFQQLLLENVNQIMDTSDPKNIDPLVKPMIDLIKSHLETKKISVESLEDETVMGEYLDMINMDALFLKAQTMLCTRMNGVMRSTNSGVDWQCSFADRKSCDESYSWPLVRGDTYAEFNDKDGICQTASFALRGICEMNNIPYNTKTGICDIDSNYCKKKGADWAFNPAINQYDCHINTGQEIAEFIFGTTITRGLKQVFDPAQYESCNADEADDGYFCRSDRCPPDKDRGSAAGSLLCYPKCKPGFHPFGCCICSPDCPEGFTDDGATCRRPGWCPPDKEHDGALCYDKCKEGYDGVGPVCWQKCPKDFVDTGAFCSKGGEVITKKSRTKTHTCPSGYTNMGLTCSKGGDVKAKTHSCPKGYTDMGVTCTSGDVKVKTHTCPSGYTNMGLTCSGGGDVVAKKHSCPKGYTDFGFTCTGGGGLFERTRLPDMRPCGDGMRDDGASCWKDTYGRGTGRGVFS